MSSLTLRKVSITSAHTVVAEFMQDYDVPLEPLIFVGWTELDEYVVLFAAEDGHGLLLVTQEPDVYVEAKKKLSVLLNNTSQAYVDAMGLLARSSPGEWIVDAGRFDVSRDAVTVAAKASLF